MRDVIPLPQIPVEKAKLEHRRYCELLKTHPDDHVKTMKDAYYALSKGQPIIDIYQAFKVTGKHNNDRPRLAIARANLKKIVFQRRGKKGAGAFWSPGAWEWFGTDWNLNSRNCQTALPDNTFGMEWNLDTWKRNEWSHFTTVQTMVPPIPAEFHPKKSLERYFILWEVDQDGWEPIPEPPGDPMLLKRLSPNLFTVLAAWDLTELEKAVLRGTLMQ